MNTRPWDSPLRRPKVVCIIQARMGSTRLPGKSLLPLGGQPLLAHVVARAKRATAVDTVVLALPDLEQDDPLAELGCAHGVEVFRGHPTDLVHRYHHAAIRFAADVVVRIPADNPLIDPREIDRIIRYYLSAEVDFASNITLFLDNHYPDGLGAEVFSAKLLQELHERVGDSRHREHVTTYFRENPQQFRLGTVECPAHIRRPDIVLDVNTPDDYQFMRILFDDLTRPDQLIDITNIIQWYDTKGIKRKK